MSPVLQIGNVPPHIPVVVVNFSVAELPIERLDLPDWITVASPPEPLPAGGSVRFTIKALTKDMKKSEAATIRVHTKAGSAEFLVIAMEPTPLVRSIPSELEVWDLPAGGKLHIPLRLEPAASYLRVTGVKTGPAAGLEVLSSLENTVLCSPGNGIPVLVQAASVQFQNQKFASLLVEFEGPHGPSEVEVPIQVAVRNPPQIRWDGEHEKPAAKYRIPAQKLEFGFSNRSVREGGGMNGCLQIQAVGLEPLPGFNIPLRCLTRMPVTLRGAESVTVSFEADLSEAPVSESTPLKFTLRAQTNGPALEKPAYVFVSTLAVYDGVLAIDFGSSNTCCAVTETGREYERLSLDGSSIASPTIVRYMDLSGPEPEVEIGSRVQELVTLEEQVAASAIDHLKQKLGYERQAIPVRPTKATDWTSRTATDAASDYLHEIRRIVESNKLTIFTDFILTHPAICSLRQYRNLQLALDRAFGGKERKVRFLQEPVAALVPFMVGQARDPNISGYTVASFDLGGGTTDIAVVRVEHITSTSGRLDIRPEIRYSRGVRFGGEDLTNMVVAELEARFTRLIDADEPGAVLIRKNVTGASEEDIRLNSYKLRQAADFFKASLSDEKGSVPQPPILDIRIMAAGGMTAKNFPRTFADLRAAGDIDLEKLFLDEVRARVEEHAMLLSNAIAITGNLDIIQLSGKTTYLPIVSETIRRMFPESHVVRAADPKECVVTGACLSRSMNRGSKVRLVLPGGASRSTSSIGSYEAREFEFTECLPTGVEIPTTGLQGQFPLPWFGSERVAIWENLGVTNEELRSKGGSNLLNKLGTWVPQQETQDAEADGWPLRLVLKDFILSVTAIGPAGEEIQFTRLGETGEL